MSETDIVKNVQLEASKLGHRLFRNNVAMAWVGRVIRTSSPMTVTLLPGDVLLRNARPLHAGLCEGSSDLIGYSKDGKFIGCEIKTPMGRLTEQQISFLLAVQKSGGVAFCAHSVEEFVEKINRS